MSQKTAKVGITVLVLATAFGVLLYTSLGESMQFYKYTDEVMANPSEWQGKNLQVHGFVVPGSIAMKPGTSEYRFDMQRNGKVMRAFYTGIVPDTFKNDSEVVLTGTADVRRLPRHRHDGQVPVEVRRGSLGGPDQGSTQHRSRTNRRRLAPWPHSATTCCWRPSSSPPTRPGWPWPGARRRSTALVESGVGAFYLVAAIMAAASSVIVHAFISGDYSIKYVQRYSDSAQPLFFKLTSYWGGLDGSIMFWVTLLSVFGTVAVYVNRERHRELIPYVVAIIAVVEMFFLFLMVVHNNPFETFLTQNPQDGTGLNPLLQNFLMVIHPPTMYLGFVGLTIPYAFGMAALITGYLDDSWLRAVRRWTMISWLFLSFGLGLGMIWAYEELGWGGYWGWDPVENAGLLPWFTATAFLHSVMVQERRGMLRVWNVALVITTFFLTIFGTFMTRSGVVQSVHAFGDDPELARMFTIFMVSIIVFSFGLLIYRLPLLKAATSSIRGCRVKRRSWPTTGSCCSRRCSCCSRRCSPR
jgi:cytochrome c-type biogenesis protein CcmE/ABC-type transport system involved in cytochrome c biogenesis permease subunit